MQDPRAVRNTRLCMVDYPTLAANDALVRARFH
jgi:hypothetical protein